MGSKDPKKNHPINKQNPSKLLVWNMVASESKHEKNGFLWILGPPDAKDPTEPGTKKKHHKKTLPPTEI